MMISDTNPMRILHCGEDGSLEEVSESRLAEWLEQRTGYIWLDLQGPECALDSELLEERLGVHSDVIRDALQPRLPPKVESLGDHTFMLLRGLDAQSSSIEFGTIQIGAVVGGDFLVTRHVQTSPSTNRLWNDVLADPGLAADGPGGLAVRLAQRVADRYLPIVLNLEHRLEEMEEEMFDRPDDRLLGELLVYKRQLKRLRRIASYHVSMFTRLQNERFHGIDRSLRHEVDDTWTRMERVVSLASFYNELANDLMNGYLSLTSHRLNHIMKVLTIVTVIFVPLTFIAGIYGMNFEFMPELGWDGAYFVVLGVMFTTVVALLALFRRQGWL